MNTLKLIAIVATVLVITSSCEEPVKFIEPQPTGKSNLSHLPNYMKGLYKSTDDDYFVEITNKMIVKKQSTLVVISKAEADTSEEFQLKGDLLTDSRNNITFKVNLINDTLQGTINLTDTLFSINEGNILRNFKGYYFINIKNDDGSYAVKMISYKRGGNLTIASIQKEEIENLKAVTGIEEPNDSTFNSDYQFKPTRKEFKQFVNDMHGFRNTESYIKVK